MLAARSPGNVSNCCGQSHSVRRKINTTNGSRRSREPSGALRSAHGACDLSSRATRSGGPAAAAARAPGLENALRAVVLDRDATGRRLAADVALDAEDDPGFGVERETGFEPATLSLGKRIGTSVGRC